MGEYRYTRETIDSESNLAGENPCLNVIPSPRIPNPAVVAISFSNRTLAAAQVNDPKAKNRLFLTNLSQIASIN